MRFYNKHDDEGDPYVVCMMSDQVSALVAGPRPQAARDVKYMAEVYKTALAIRMVEKGFVRGLVLASNRYQKEVIFELHLDVGQDYVRKNGYLEL